MLLLARGTILAMDQNRSIEDLIMCCIKIIVCVARTLLPVHPSESLKGKDVVSTPLLTYYIAWELLILTSEFKRFLWHFHLAPLHSAWPTFDTQ